MSLMSMDLSSLAGALGTIFVVLCSSSGFRYCSKHRYQGPEVECRVVRSNFGFDDLDVTGQVELIDVPVDYSENDRIMNVELPRLSAAL